MSQTSQLPDIDLPTLTGVLRRVFGRDVEHISNWHVQPSSGGWEATTSIYRISGHAQIGGAATPWTLVLRIVRAVPERDAPEHWNYWRREPLLYQSGLLNDLPGEIAEPECYEVEPHPDGSIWIWLESLTDDNSPWPLATYGEVARQFDRFNGTYLAGRPLPDTPCVTRNWLRAYVEAYAPIIERLPELRNDPLVRCAVPEQLAHDLARLNDEREQLLSALDRLPQTFGHLDAWRGNLFVAKSADGQQRVTAVDWTFTGIAAVGQELAPLVYGNAHDPDMEHVAIARYIEGLRDAGWDGEAWHVKLGYSAAMALEYGLGTIGFYVNALFDERERAYLAQLSGKPLEEVAEEFADWVAFPMSRVDQAFGLLADI